jgi:hypothetical protein
MHVALPDPPLHGTSMALKNAGSASRALFNVKTVSRAMRALFRAPLT